MKQTENPDSCSFCNKHKDAVIKLIVGEDVAICNECVELCETLLVDEPVAKPVDHVSLDPRLIQKHLDQYVIGQNRAKMVLAVAIANHYKRIRNQDKNTEIEKVNILMLGPTGSGKTLLARSVARYLDVPFVIADATSLTEAGYVGDDVESLISRLYSASGNDIEKTQRGIVFVDEIDKISRRSESQSITRDVSGEGVQQALLKLVEGTKCRITPTGGRKHPNGETVEIDTTDILVIDLVKFGMIPEFVGRFPSCVALNELALKDLISILTDIKHSYVDQYKWLFVQDSIKLEFAQSALEKVAENTLKNKTGARGLHSELERVLLPHMFNLARYKEQGIDQVKITDDLVNIPIELEAPNEQIARKIGNSR